MANSFTGTFSTPAKQAEFMAITTSVADSQFENESGLTSISLPQATTIGVRAFRLSKLTRLSLPEATVIGKFAFSFSKITSLDLPKAITIADYVFTNSPLTSLSAPKATTIGYLAFNSIVNAATTTVLLPSKFNTDSEKDRILKNGYWDHITFIVKPTKSFIELGDKWISKQFEAKPGKKLIGITPGGTNTPIIKINSLKLDFTYTRAGQRLSMTVFINGVNVGTSHQNGVPLARWHGVGISHPFTYKGAHLFLKINTSVWIYDNSSLTEGGFYVNETVLRCGKDATNNVQKTIYTNNGNSGHWVGADKGIYELTKAENSFAEKAFNKYIPGKKLILDDGIQT